MLKCINNVINNLQKFQGETKRRKRWLFHATDFQSLMYFNFIFCKILGIFPYRIKVSTFERSKSGYILWTIITCVICIYELIMFYKLNFSGRVRLEVPKTITYNFHFVLGAFAAIVWRVSSDRRMRLLQCIQEISSRLPAESYQRLSKLIHAKDIFGFIFLLWLLLIFLLNSSEMVIDTTFESLRVYIAMIVFQMDMLYMNCVCVLKACLKEINNTLENLRELCVVNDISRRIDDEQRNPYMLTELKALKKQHLMISDTVQMLNVIFSLQLLGTIVVVFKQITFALYFHIVQWQDGISISLDKQIRHEFFVSLIMYYLIRIVLVVWACETGKNEATEIGTTIHNVLNTTTDEQIKYELQLFSMQILHCNNTFSSKGLTVDATLLTAMINSITTYLLILIQFLGTSHSCDGKTAINGTEAF
ncbi:PREDICTED: putative gustatory receptor 28b [Wasmannia auropunctata]|uniref:putative gustatory receptor 28b n=1 Tax=Wasmannia auropunctata TaxID=64793 RepID=UPI0005EF8DBD|nr:PREDICTED: putative gustatory receptor 28b [Wasmannia auropunctata]